MNKATDFLRVRVPLGSFTFISILIFTMMQWTYIEKDKKKESTREKMNRESMVY